MKRKYIVSFLVLFLSFLYQVDAANTFQCSYSITADSLKPTRDGRLICEMGYDSFLGLKSAIINCNWYTNFNGKEIDTWVEANGTSSFHLTEHLKSDQATCPKYVAIQTATANSISAGYFETGVKAYFTDNYEEATIYSSEGGNYYTVGDLDGLENSDLDKLMCNSKNHQYYENLFQTFQKEIDLFLDENCDKFSLSEKEKETVASVESINKYERCAEHLSFTQSYFNSQISDLEDLYSDYQCFSQTDYREILKKLTFYKTEYTSIKDQLDKSFNEKNDEDNNNDNNDNNSNGGPNYSVDNSANINTICASPSYRKPMKFIGTIINFIKIIIPMVIIAFGALDFYRAMTGAKDDEIKKSIKSLIIRIIAGVFIFLLPGIVQFVLNMVNEWSDYKNAWCCCTDCLLNPDCNVDSCSSDSCHIEGTN